MGAHFAPQDLECMHRSVLSSQEGPERFFFPATLPTVGEERSAEVVCGTGAPPKNPSTVT